MNSKTLSKGIVRAVLKLAALAAFLYFLYQIQSVIGFIVVALVLSLLGSPVKRFLMNKCKFGNNLAAIVSVLFFVLLLAGFITTFIPMVVTQSDNIAQINVAEIERDVNKILHDYGGILKSKSAPNEEVTVTSLMKKINLNIPNLLNSVFGTLGNLGMAIASIVFITFFFLKDKEMLQRNFIKVLPDEHQEKILSSIEKINHLLSRYFLGLLGQLSVMFGIYIIVLLIFGIENAFAVAFFCAVLNIIPYIGPLIAAVLAVLFSILTFSATTGNVSDAFPTALYVLIGFQIGQFIDNNITGPLIFSNSVNSHPLEVFIVILIAGMLFGVVGMIAAVPLYTAIKVILKEFFPNNPVVKVLAKDI